MSALSNGMMPDVPGNPYFGMTIVAALEKWRAEYPGLAAENAKPFDAQAYWAEVANVTNSRPHPPMLSLAETLILAKLDKDKIARPDFLMMRECLARALANDWQYGFLFAGGTGNGKTTLLELIKKRGWTGLSQHFWHYATAADLSRELAANANSNGFSDDRSWSKSHMCIDEVGGEPTNNHYGQKNEVFGVLLDARERAFRFGGTTVMASNLTLEALAARYGDRAMSRLRAICVDVEMVTPDNRVPARLRKEADNEPTF